MRSLLAVVVSCSVALPGGAADPPQKTDRYGDPLPHGALMRFGTLRTRAPISSFGIEKDGTVVTVSQGGELRRWTAAEDKSSDPIQLPALGKTYTFNSPQVSPDGKYVAACSTEKVFVWAVPSDTKAKPKEVAAFEIACGSHSRFSPDGSKLVVATGPDHRSSIATAQSVHLCDIKTGKATKLEGTDNFFTGVRFSGDGKRIVALATDKFFLWDTTTTKQITDFKLEKSSYYVTCALNQQGDLLVAQPHQHNVKFEWHFFDVKTSSHFRSGHFKLESEQLDGPRGFRGARDF